MNQFKNLPGPLSLGEEQDLAGRIQDGSDVARNRLVMHNLRWVFSVVNSVGKGLKDDEFQELRSYAIENTLEDAERFKPQGVRFISYLAKFLRKRLKEYRYGIDSQCREKMSINGVYPLRLNQISSISGSYQNEEGWKNENWEDSVRDESIQDFDTSLVKEEREKAVEQILDTLPERERIIIEGYFFEEKTLEEIGWDFGISLERVRQIRNRGMGRLRRKKKSLRDFLPESSGEYSGEDS